jgi:exodeoxyribonuclease VII small subunit
MSVKKNFEQLMKEIESITIQLESEQSDLEISLKLFKQGQILIQEAKTRLQYLEHEFEVINKQSEDSK